MLAHSSCMWSPLMEAGSSKLALLHCSSLHACLAAYANILRRDPNTTCITIVTAACDVTVVGPISKRSDELGGFWSKHSVKSSDKNHIKGGQNLWSTVICSTEYEQSDWESTRRSFQSVRSYEEICGAFDSKGGRRPDRSTSTVNGDCVRLCCFLLV